MFVLVFLRTCLPCVSGCPQGPEEDIRFPGTGIISVYELSNVGAGNHPLVPVL